MHRRIRNAFAGSTPPPDACRGKERELNAAIVGGKARIGEAAVVVAKASAQMAATPQTVARVGSPLAADAGSFCNISTISVDPPAAGCMWSEGTRIRRGVRQVALSAQHGHSY
ncbi:unnamed protein product [Closterium sp. NIES-64]|nr:unnamed protein product [Closterium sp. NIES-64]